MFIKTILSESCLHTTLVYTPFRLAALRYDEYKHFQQKRKGRTRVHPFANKHLKSLLNIAAMGAVQLKGEYKTYYQRRTLEGKNKMSTLNIIRNKLVLRVFAVVKRQTRYVDLTKFAA